MTPKKKAKRLAKPEIKDDIIVKPMGIREQFSPTLPKSTFYDYRSDGLVVMAERDGQYLLNASRVRLGLKPLTPEQLVEYRDRYNKGSTQNAFNPRELCVFSFKLIIQAQEPAQCLEGLGIEEEDNIISQTFSSLYYFAKSPPKLTQKESDSVYDGYQKHKERYCSYRSIIERIMFVSGSLAAVDVMRLNDEGYFD